MRFKLFSTCVDHIEFDIGMMSTQPILKNLNNLFWSQDYKFCLLKPTPDQLFPIIIVIYFFFFAPSKKKREATRTITMTNKKQPLE